MAEAVLLYLALTGGVALCLYVGGGWRPLVPWTAAVVVWTFASPLWAGPPLILKSVERGPYYDGRVIPWASTTVTTPGRIVRASSRQQVLDAVAQASRLRVVGSAHSFADLFGTSGTSLKLDYCTIELKHTAAVLTAGGGCTIAQLRETARVHGLVVRGLGAIYQQTVGGSIATSLHGDERSRFIDYIEQLEVVNASGHVNVVDDPATLDGSRGEAGIIVTASVRCEQAFAVRRVEDAADMEGVLAVVERVRNNASVAGGGQCVVLQGADDCAWHRWEMFAAAPSPFGRGQMPPSPAGGGVAWTFMVDNIALAITMLFPWLAPVGIASSPFVWKADEDGIIDIHYAQEHAPVNMLPTGEIMAEDCKGTTRRLMALARPYGPLSLVIRPAEGGCWIDYAVLPYGKTQGFYDDVERQLGHLTFHRGKLGPRQPSAGGQAKFAIEPAELYSLDARRVAWVALVVLSFAMAAALALTGENEGYSRV
jgi:hypothetical protein